MYNIILFIVLFSVISCAKIVRQSAMEIKKEIIPPAAINVSKAPIQTTYQKKSFFSFMRPIIEAENTRILHIRRRLMQLQVSTHLSKQSIPWLQQIAEEYRVSLMGKPDNRFWHQILSMVDIVPVDMAMAQAANESAWGNSRFAREANNYFGQWCFQKGCGIIPLRRNAGALHEVKRFDSPAASVRAYIKNMNTLHAYQAFRKIRQSLRHQGKPLNPGLLTIGLSKYSERGADYVKIIRSIIRKNKHLMAKR